MNNILKENVPVGLCSDHAGWATKQAVIAWLDAQGIAYKDFGTYNEDSCDYPDFAHACALAVERGECYPGIGICGSGEGINMTLNKHQGIRSALCETFLTTEFEGGRHQRRIDKIPVKD